ncbi:MAG: hypothetical protein KatS3mg038_3789 [Candidatus Kapaibacterium sp.]|nr:MAG: hypothetical protein KatS3mg038_3789 [Candidatus Kapabacteria bacterium]
MRSELLRNRIVSLADEAEFLVKKPATNNAISRPKRLRVSKRSPKRLVSRAQTAKSLPACGPRLKRRSESSGC